MSPVACFPLPPRRHPVRFGISLLLLFLPGLVVAETPSVALEVPTSLASPISLDTAAPVQLALAGGEERSLAVTVKAGEYWHFMVTQLGVDVAVSLSNSAGELLAQTDLAAGGRGREHLLVLTLDNETLRLQISAADGQDAGQVRVAVAEQRSAKATDEQTIAAERFYLEALSATRSMRHQEAIELYGQSLPIWQSLGEPEGEAKVLHNLGDLLYQEGAYDEAAHNLERALLGWQQAGNETGAADTLNMLGLHAARDGDFAAATEHYQAAALAAAAAQDRRRESRFLNNLGRGQKELGEWGLAHESYQRSLELRVAEGDRRGEAMTRVNFGTFFYNLGEYHRALEHLHGAVELLDETRDARALMTAWNSLGSTYDMLGQFAQAQSYLEQALTVAKERQDWLREAGILNNLGWSQHFAADPAAAVQSFDAALTILGAAIPGANKHVRTEAAVHTNRARSLRQLGRHGEVSASFEKALVLRQEGRDSLGEARTRAELAEWLVEQGDLDGALLQVTEARLLNERFADQGVEAFVSSVEARIEQQRGALDAAEASMVAAIKALTRDRGATAGYDHRAAFMAPRQRYYEQWIELLMQRHEQDPQGDWPARAFAVAEQARARSLADVLADARVEAGEEVTPELEQRELNLGRRLSGLEIRRLSLLAEQQPATTELAEIERRLATALAEYRHARAQIHAASPRWQALQEPVTVSAVDLQRHLKGSGTAVVELSLGKERGFGWLITERQIHSWPLPARAEVIAAARQVYGLLTARAARPSGEDLAARRQRIRLADSDFVGQGGALLRTLLGPALARLANERLAIVAPGALEYLPFAALPVAPSKTPQSYRPLLVEREVVYLPSASVWLEQQQAARRAAPKMLAILADPVFDRLDPRLVQVASTRSQGSVTGEFRRLPDSRQEADRIAELAGDHSLLALGFAASRELVEQGELADYKIVHFATHGIVDSQHPELSSLVLSMVNSQGQAVDGFLRLHDIFRLRLNADLVVLSACQTALGQEVRGEGLIGLTRGFMYAGARRVMASLWTVQDRATRELMERFYRSHLREGTTTAAALRQAQLELRQQAGLQAPYFWAGFVLQGDWR